MIDQLAGRHFAAATPARFSLTVQERADLELNDAGNAARLLAAYGSDMIFVSGKDWGIWDGNRFSFQSGGLRAAEIAARLPALIQEEIDAVKNREFDEFTLNRRMRAEAEKASKGGKGKRYVDLDDVAQDLRGELIAKLSAHKIKCGNVDKQKKALEAAAWQVRVEVQELDSNPWVLVVKNGMVDLKAAKDQPPREMVNGQPTPLSEWRRGWLKPVDRSSHPTKCAGVPFVPGADCPNWEAFMELIFPDPLIRACWKRCAGALLFGRNVAQVALLLRGGGGNGKSTLTKIIGEVLDAFGGYAAPARVEMFLQTQSQSPSQATPEEMDLPGARVIIASEPAVTDIFSAKKIKSLTGGDLRPIRGLNKDQFIYRPSAIPVISFNRTPKIKDEDEGTRRRLVFIPLEVNLRELPPEKRKTELQAEAELMGELTGILNWMLDGFRDFYARIEAGVGTPPGIDPPEAMQALKDKIMEAADPVGSFLKDCAVLDSRARTPTPEFFRAFKAWARENGARVFSDAALRDNLTEKGFEKGKYNGNMVFKGFSWQDDELVRKYLATPDFGGDRSSYD